MLKMDMLLEAYDIQAKFSIESKKQVIYSAFICKLSTFGMITDERILSLFSLNKTKNWNLKNNCILPYSGYCFDYWSKNSMFFIGSSSGRYMQLSENTDNDGFLLHATNKVHSSCSKIVNLRIIQKNLLIITLGSDKYVICQSILDNTRLFKKKFDVQLNFGIQIMGNGEMCVVASKKTINFIRISKYDNLIPFYEKQDDANISTLKMSWCRDLLAVGHDNGIIRLIYRENFNEFQVHVLVGKKNKILNIHFMNYETIMAFCAASCVTMWKIDKIRLPISISAYTQINVSPSPCFGLQKLFSQCCGKNKKFCHSCGIILKNRNKYQVSNFFYYGFEKTTYICNLCVVEEQEGAFDESVSLYIEGVQKNFCVEKNGDYIFLTDKMFNLRILRSKYYGSF